MTATAAATAPANTDRNVRAIAWRAVAAVTLVYAVGQFVPFAPAFWEASLDSSFSLAQQGFYATGALYGRDVIYTFGPYGFIYPRAYHPATFGAMLVAWCFFAVAFWAGSLAVVRRATGSPLVGLLWIALLMTVASLSSDAFFLGIAALLVLGSYQREERGLSATIAALVVAVAFLSLVKLSFLPVALVTVGYSAYREADRDRRFPMTLLLAPVALALFWFLAGQGMSNVLDFVRASVEIGTGHVQAMVLPAPLVEAAAFVAVSAAMITLVAVAVWQRGRYRAMPVALALAALPFVAFKAGYVRYDPPHAAISLAFALVFGLLVLPAFWSRADRWWRGAALATGAAVLALTWTGVEPISGDALPSVLISRAPHAGRSLAAGVGLLGGDGHLRERFATNMEEIRRSYPLSPRAGTVDLYAFDTAYLLAHGFDYAPRPAFQSYVAFTPWIAEANARHLRGPVAPDEILFRIAPIDGRYPSLDDGLSWPELFTRYEITGVEGEHLTMRRLATPSEYRVVPLRTITASIGDEIAVGAPEEGPVWARIRVRQTLLGRLVTTLFRTVPPSVEITTAAGRTATHRLTPAAEGGFLLSPLVDSQLAFVGLASPDWRALSARAHVERLRVTVSQNGAYFFEPEVGVDLFRLDFTHRELPRDGVIGRYNRLLRFASYLVESADPEGLGTLPNGIPYLSAHPASKVRIPVPASARSLTLSYGIREGAWSNGGATDGVEFRASVLDGDVPRIVWSDRLDPSGAIGDRGEQSARIDLTTMSATELVVETLAAGSPAWDWAYWSDARFE